jgi:hypothetical protein
MGCAGPLSTLGGRPSSATHWVAGYSFPPLSGESSVLVLWWRGKVSPAVWHSGKCWTSVHLGRQISWQLQSSEIPLSGGSGIEVLRQTLLLAGMLGNAEPLITLRMKAFWYHPLSSRLQLYSSQWGIWCSCSLMEKQGLSSGQAQWEALGLFVP